MGGFVIGFLIPIGILVLTWIFISSFRKNRKASDTGTKQQGTTANTHGAHDEHATHSNTQKETWWKKNSVGIIYVFLFIAGIVLTIQLFIWVSTSVKEFFTPKPRPHYDYTYTDNWVPYPENSRIIYFTSEYKNVERFTIGNNVRLKFLNADSSYCVKNIKTLDEACGDAGTDVDIPSPPGREIFLEFKTRDGQKNGELYVQSEKNVPIEHKVLVK